MEAVSSGEIEFRELTEVDASLQQDQSDNVVWTPSRIVFSIFLFLLAAICEIGGGWLIFVGIRERDKRKPMAMYLIFGILALTAYGFIPVAQPSSSFGRIFAVYGGFFIVGSYLWGSLVDGLRLDLGDYIGCAISLVGVCISWFWVR